MRACMHVCVRVCVHACICVCVCASDEDGALPLLLLRYLLETYCMKDVKPSADQSQWVISVLSVAVTSSQSQSVISVLSIAVTSSHMQESSFLWKFSR